MAEKYAAKTVANAALSLVDEHKYIMCRPTRMPSTAEISEAAFKYTEMYGKQGALRGGEHTYIKCKTDPKLSLPVSVTPLGSFTIRHDTETEMACAARKGVIDTVIVEPITYLPFLSMFTLMVFLVLFNRRSSRAQRKKTIRHLIDTHPKDRSAEVKKLADQMGIMSLYDDSESETYFDAVPEKEMLAEDGP